LKKLLELLEDKMKLLGLPNTKQKHSTLNKDTKRCNI